MFEKLGKFEIRRSLGQGAMGEVYLGVDPTIGREVAIKTILPSAATGAEAKERFAREAKAAGVLNHPNLVTIYEFGEDQGVMYIAMEFVKGHDLEELLRDGSLSRSEALEVLAQVCDGLAFAHQNHIVHRDIKPSNVRVMRDGKRLQAKVMDFGVARVGNSDMTATGMVMGTVSYMAPEYIRTGKPDPRSDLFAVGVMLYESLSGRKPFSGDTTPTILYKIVNEAPSPIDPSTIQGISPAIHNVLERGLDKDPDRRYQLAEDLAKALRAAKDPTWQGHIQEGTTLLPAASQGPAPATAPLPAGASEPTVRQAGTEVAQVPAPHQATGGPASGGPSPVAPRPAAPSGSKVGLVLGILVLLGLGLMGAGGYAYWRWKKGQEQPAIAVVDPAAASAPALPPATPGEAPASAGNPAPPSMPAGQAGGAGAGPAGGSSTKGMATGSGPRDYPVSGNPSTSPRHEGGEAPRPAEPKPAARPSNDPFAPENLEKLEAPQRRNLAMTAMSEGTALMESDPAKALELLKGSIAANPGEPRAYAWAVVLLYDQKRYSECRGMLDQASRRGFGAGQLSGMNARLKRILDNESFSPKIPGGRGY